MLNGELLDAAEAERFDAVVTTDRNLRHQQSLAGRPLGILVLPTTNWSKIRRNVAHVSEALDRLRPGTIGDVSFGS